MNVVCNKSRNQKTKEENAQKNNINDMAYETKIYPITF